MKTNSVNIISLKENVTTDSKVNVYPNPTSAYLIIQYDEVQDGKFELYNAMGQLVLITDLVAGNRKVQVLLSSIPSGIYYYKCIFERQTKCKITIHTD